MRDICQRSRVQISTRKYQRHSRNWNQRQADVAVPRSRQARVSCPQSDGVAYQVAVPSAMIVAPDDQNADDIDEGDQQQLGESQNCAAAMPTRWRPLNRVMALSGISRRSRNSCMIRGACADARQLGANQQRHRHQKADVNIDIRKKRHGQPAAQQVAVDSRQQEQRQPGEQDEHHDARHHRARRVARQVPDAQKLKKRAAEDEREVPRIAQNAVEGYWSWHDRILDLQARCSACHIGHKSCHRDAYRSSGELTQVKRPGAPHHYRLTSGTWAIQGVRLIQRQAVRRLDAT